MGVYGSYGVEVDDEPIAWFRRVVVARGDDTVHVSGWPTSLADLERFAQRFTALRHDFASVVQEREVHDAAAALDDFASEGWPEGLHDLALHLRSTSESLPWKALGMRKRTVLRDVHGFHLERTGDVACAWRSFENVPKLHAHEQPAFAAWREAQEVAFVDEMRRRVAPIEPRVARVDEVGTEQTFFPFLCLGHLALGVQAAPRTTLGRMLPPSPVSSSVAASGPTRVILAGAACFPSPSYVRAPDPEPIRADDVRALDGFEGRLELRADVRTGPRGGKSELTLVLSDTPSLRIDARSGLEDRQRLTIEKALGVRLALEDVF